MIRTLSLTVLLCFIGVPNAFAMTITSDAPGNTIRADGAITLQVKDAQGSVNYELTDYFGSSVKSGSGSEIKITGLKPGWYLLKCKDNSTEVSASIGVVIDRGNAPLPADGRVCTDVAGAWLVKNENHDTMVRMIHLAGISWVRERLAWRSTEKERGVFSWGVYRTLADKYAREGVHICQMWHDSPEWSHPSSSNNICPDDLRDLYNFARAAASEFSGRISVWEIWNEPDTRLLLDAADRYSGMVKAIYLGYKDGNPKATVLQGALLKGVTPTEQCMYESGTTDYFDIFNWHIYDKPSVYPGALAAHIELLSKYGAADRPIWLTEAGIALEGSEGPNKKILSFEDQRTQCQFIPRFEVMSAVAGTDKSFFFVLPSYNEGPVQWAALQPDMTPYPSFLALSAAANIIGESTYKGEYKSGNDVVTAQMFSTAKGNVLVVWSDKDSEIIVPTDRETLRLANIFGAESTIACNNGYVRLKTGPEAVYLLDIGKTIENKLAGTPRAPGRLPKLKPSRIVIYGHANMDVSKVENAYKMADHSAFDYTVEAYNFNNKTGASGSVEVSVPDGWSIGNPKRDVTLEPMGRQVLTFKVQPAGKVGDNEFRVVVHSKFKNEKPAQCVSLFSYDLLVLQPYEHKALGWAKDPDKWVPDASENCALKMNNPEPDVLRIDTKFEGEGDRWAYPVMRFDKPVDMSGYDAVAFDLDVPVESYKSKINIIFVQQDGAAYAGTIVPSDPGKRHLLFKFSDLQPYGKEGKAVDGHLETSSIVEVKLGCDAGREYLVFDTSNFDLVKFDKP
ncbi:hypothetical protein LLG46_01765 [bacterium]|nr:hypothetical protein [bacterium]